MSLKYVKRDNGTIVESIPRPKVGYDPIDETDPEYVAFKASNIRTDGQNANRRMMADPFTKQLVKYLAAKEGRTIPEVRQDIRNA